MKFLSQINVNTEYTLPIVDGNNGQVLTTDGNGAVYWGNVSAGVTNLDGLTDVILTSPSSGQLLRYGIPPGSGEANPVWYNFTPNYLTPSSSIDALSDVTISTATTGQILQWSGAQWVNATLSTVEYVSKVQHLVKCGVAVTKGQAVYVTSADGTNMIVGLASNATEATSSKVIGLAASTGAINDQIFVVTEGLIAGLNTSTATAGDPVWLGTGGNLIFGLANKPVAPAHLVYLGVVTRVQSNNGEIFVNVQNGFELNELHDVLISSPSTGQLIRRDSDGLWKNWTPNYLTSLPTHNHDDLYYTESEIAGFFGGEAPIAGYNATNWDTAYGWGNHADYGYLTSFTEADTLATVTGRGSTTTNTITLGGLNVISGGTAQVSYFGSTATTQYADIALRTNDGQGEIFRAGTAYTSYGGAKALNIWNSNGPISLHPNGISNVLFLSNAGNVGINTTNPTYKLHVNGTFSSNSFWTESSAISYWGVGGTAYGYLTWDTNYARIGATGNKTLYLGDDNQITIIDGGNVGINGAPQSNERFSVNAAEGIWALSAYRSGVQIGGVHVNDSILNIQGSGGTEVRLSTSGNATWNGNVLATQTWVGANYYNTGQIEDFFAGAEAISGYNKSNWDTAYNDRITAAAVTGTSTKTLTLTQGDGGTVTATWTDYDTDNDAQTISYSSGTNELSISNGNSITLDGLATEDYVLSQGFTTFQPWNSGTGSINYTAGNVGVGTALPTKKLHVVSGDNEGIFMQGSTNGGHWFDFKSANSNHWSMGAQPGLMGWYNRTDSTYKMVISDGGNVGINTTNPGARLHVVGNTYVQSGALFVDTIAGYATNLVSIAANTNFTVPSGIITVAKDLGTNDYANVGQHNMQLRIRKASLDGGCAPRSLELGVLDNGTGIIQANHCGVGYNTLSLNPVAGSVLINGQTAWHAGNLNPSGFAQTSGAEFTGPVIVNVGDVAVDTMAFKVAGPSDYDSLTIGMRGTPDYDSYIASFGNDIHFYSGKGVTTENHSFFWYTSKSGSGQHAVVAMTLDHLQNLTIGGTYTENSSVRYKDNITPLESVSGKVEKLEAVTYTKKGDELVQLGLIAESVSELFPEIVKYDEEGRPDGVSYTRLSVILLKAMQEQNAVIAALTERVNKLENK